MATKGITAFLILMGSLFLPSAAMAFDPDAASRLCRECKTLFANPQTDQPQLGELVRDILTIFDQMEKRDLPRALDYCDLSLEGLKSCNDKASTVAKFLLPECPGPSRSEPPRIDASLMLPWTAIRQQRSEEYTQLHTLRSSTRLESPQLVVTHWTGGRNLEHAMKIFGREEFDQQDRRRFKLFQNGRMNVSCHFVVDRDGSIYQLLGEDQIARHAIGLNHSTYCIENVGGPDYPLTAQQAQANASLIRYLKRQHPTIEGVVGHSETRALKETFLFEERKRDYRDHDDGKPDPGADFLSKLRQLLKSCGE